MTSRRIVAIGGTLVAALGASSASGGEGLTLHEVERLVLDRSPQVKAALADVDAARGRVRQAGFLPNPEAQVSVEHLGVDRSWQGGEADITTGLEMSFPMGGRIRRGVEAASAGVETARAASQAVLADAVAGARSRFAAALAAQGRVGLARELLEMAEEAHELVVARVQAGDVPESEAWRTAADVSAARLDLVEASAAEEAALGSLAAAWGGAPGDVSKVQGELVPKDGEALPPLDDLVRRLANSWPVRRSVEAQAEQEREVQLQEALAVPDLSAGLSYRGYSGFEESALVLSFSMPLPLLDRNQGAADEARSLARKAKYEKEAVKAEVAAALHRAYVEMTAQRERYRMMQTEVVPTLQKAFHAVEVGLEQGKLHALDLLDARRQLALASSRSIDAAERYALARIEVERLAIFDFRSSISDLNRCGGSCPRSQEVAQ